MVAMSGYENLVVWQKAMLLAQHAYRISGKFPACERFALADQVRRSAVSVPSNIAEGQGRITRGEFRQFLGHARGSLYELETQICLAVQFEYISESVGEEFMRASREVRKLLNALLGSLQPSLTNNQRLTTNN
jgi:four helix bundle protein